MPEQTHNMQHVDLRGLRCPATLITALKKINAHREELKKGELELVFLTDNRDSTITIPETSQNMGYEARVTKESGYYLISIRGRVSGLQD